MSEKRFKDEKSCSNCRNQMTGFDGGFFGLPFTCECRIYGETEGRKNCSDFEKKITKRYLLDKIKELEKENEQLKYDNFMFKGVIKTFQKVAISERKKLEKEIEESKITIQLYETDVSMRDNFLKSKGLYDEFLQCTLE